MPDPVCFNEDRGFLTSPDPYLPSSTALPSLQIPSVCKRSYNLLLSNPTASRGFGLPSGEQMIRLYVFSAFSSHTALSEEAEEQASTESWESARHQTNFIPSKVQVGSLSPGADSQNLAAAGSEELREDVCFVETESSVPDERSSRGGSYLAEKVSKPLSCAGQPRVVQKPLAMLWSPILYRITANRAADRDGLYATPDMSPTWATAGCRRTSIGANSTGNGVVTNGSKSSSAITADSVAHAKRLQADEFAGYETQSSLVSA
ncbi:unnamed protein product [Protopolystoma xenopodis]|uniref:Uncharacterized protein n=1 Tax=Protopolystoma xenopodis TaxID=117903 RepID=A0A448WAS5_9PLAT|nr:unnamed protein product [Protopolystoma xenopodis]